ncbi:MAG: BtrH N-terminal domain-containing protein [Promethearchaeota archaeon]
MKYLINNFVHKVGVHCESSSMRDLFEYYGFPMTEAMAFGLDATMGFNFFDTTNIVSFIPDSEIPFFLGGKQGTIEPDSLACRLLGIILRKQTFTSSDKAWIEAKKKLDQGIPLILRVDLGYLPYFEMGGEFHFGGHAITLAGYDDEKMVAYVGDSEFEGFQEVSIEILKKCRNSDYGPKFMQPQNAQFSMLMRPDGKHPPLAASIKLAIQKVVNNMLRPSMNNFGIQGLKRFANSIPKWKEKLEGSTKDTFGNDISIARTMFKLIYGYIESWGTGGATFRNLYKSFMEELLILQELKEGLKAWKREELNVIEESVPLIEDSAYNWTLFAQILKKAADEHEDNCMNYVNFDELNEIAILIQGKEEELFKKLSKIKL